ncbi:MAG TPA: LysR family transcriptional regulator [Polyangiales bacterium]|nr:LysR family transcriptional regulator [Polyangiales bacterium]
MDLTLVRTFLEVAKAGSLLAASERLHVTQAAVTARLQSLEEELGQRLFVRNKGGAQLTPAGHAFLPHAAQLLRVWERARAEVSRRPVRQASLSIGAEMSLWSGVLLNWVVTLRSDRPSVAIRAEVNPADRLLEQIQNGTLDMAVLYSGQRRPGVDNTIVLQEQLVAVSNRPNAQLDVDDYIYVDWGPEFRGQHDQALPELHNAALVVDLGPLALRYLIKLGGCGYFRTRAIEPHLKSGVLHLVPNAPQFSFGLYAAYSRDLDPELRAWANQRLMLAAEAPVEAWA